MGQTVVVSAHLDDAVLSCYDAVLAASTVVTVFAAVPAPGPLADWDAAGGASDSHERMAERRREDAAALAIAGVGHIHLDYPEAQHVRHGIAERPAQEVVSEALRALLSSAATVLAPSALSANRWPPRLRRRRYSDHRFVRDAVLAIRPDATLYADLPYALNRRTGGFALPADVASPARTERRVRLDDETLQRKLESVRCYATQLPQLTRLFGPFLDAAGLGLEVYWEAGIPLENAEIG